MGPGILFNQLGSTRGGTRRPTHPIRDTLRPTDFEAGGHHRGTYLDPAFQLKGKNQSS